MMRSNKRKIVSDESDEDDSLKHRRSSLKVNLSYSANLTDSGNGSLGKTEIENNERGTGKLQIDKRLLRDKYDDIKTVPLQINEGIQLKSLKIILEDINTKEQTLDKNCKYLKDAILNKTKEIFDKQDELSIRTTMILANEENHSAEIHDVNADKSVFMLDSSNNQCLKDKRSTAYNHSIQYIDMHNNQREKDQSNIIVIPPNGNKQKTCKKSMNRSKLTPKRLFNEEGKQGCRIIDDVLLNKNFPLSFRKTGENNSPILSGSNKRLQLIRGRSKLHLQNQHNHSMHSSVYFDQSINIGQPIVCSTFIGENAMNEEENKIFCNEANSDAITSRATCTTNKVISMEITETHGGIRLSKGHMSIQNKNPDMSNRIKNMKKAESKDKNLEQNKATTTYVPENIHTSVKLTVQNNDAHLNMPGVNNMSNQHMTNICTTIPKQTESAEEIVLVTKTHNLLQAQERNDQINKRSEKQCTLILSDSSNTTRSSLNVNTSLDAATETNKMKNTQKSDNYRTTATSGLKVAANNEKLIALDKQDESANTIRTSLQVNTSMISMCKTWRKKNICVSKQFFLDQDKNNEELTENHSSINNQYPSSAKDKEANAIDLFENVSLIERLRNISARNQVSYNDKLKAPETESKENSKSIETKNVKYNENVTNNSGNSSSCVQATPYPISRSVLFKSQLKHRTQNLNNNSASCSNELNSFNNKQDNNKDDTLFPITVSNKTRILTGTTKTIGDDTVILEDTPSCDPFIIQEKFAVIEDTLNETGLARKEGNTITPQTQNQHTETSEVRKRGRKKLLPLYESSQLCSLVPLEEHSSTSEKSISLKRNKKKLTKKRPKKKSTNFKNDINNVKCNITIEQTCSDDNCDVSESKKKNKSRKPRKVVSKKIVIKKFVNENILNMLEADRQNKRDSIENKNSLDDFATHRTVPTQWNKYKSKKIVIVTTGLSKRDKSLVKSIVKSLGLAEVELNVSRRTTHIVSTGVRTVNLLRGIIRGCWLITLEWVLKSLESNMWLNPEEFEMKHFSKAVQENRKDRQLFGPSYIPDLFTACGLIHIEHKTTVPCDTLKELVKTAGGHITENPKFAKIIVGASGLKETWIIDSITTGELQLISLYQRK